MPLQQGDKLHIITRRLFADDVRRHFACQIDAVGPTAFRATGYAFVLDSARNEYVRRPELRTRIMPLCDIGQIINLLPPQLDINALSYQTIEGHLMVTDGQSFRLDINEFGPTR
jgi:hypothetical protein